MTLHVGAPDLKRHGRLVWPFGEDAVTAAYEVVQQAGVPRGSEARVHGFEPPAWWWQATGLTQSEKGTWRIVAVDGENGSAVFVTDGEPPAVDPLLVRALARARELSAEEAAALHRATDPAPQAADFPLGASVTTARHEEVLASRLSFPTGQIATWTAVAPGAGPAEFQRLQEAVGAYHVVLVQAEDGRSTVGLWAGKTPPATGQEARPVLRRLYRRDGAWRYQMAFAPTL